MAQNEYKGFANWETWVVNLWIDNDQKLYEYYGNVARVEVSKNKGHPKSTAFQLSLTLNEQFDTWMPAVEGPYLDLLNGAMSEINWHQIARHLVERVEEEENYAKQVN